MSDIVHERPIFLAAHTSVKPNAKGARAPRSKREVAAYELPRGTTEMKRAGGAAAKRMSRWKR